MKIKVIINNNLATNLHINLNEAFKRLLIIVMFSNTL